VHALEDKRSTCVSSDLSYVTRVGYDTDIYTDIYT